MSYLVVLYDTSLAGRVTLSRHPFLFESIQLTRRRVSVLLARVVFSYLGIFCSCLFIITAVYLL